MDLYRLPGTSLKEFTPLNLDYVFAQCISLVEWPVRLPEALVPDDRLDIDIRILADHISVDFIADQSSEENIPRMLSLTPTSSTWRKRLTAMREGGFVDDLLVEE